MADVHGLTHLRPLLPWPLSWTIRSYHWKAFLAPKKTVTIFFQKTTRGKKCWAQGVVQGSLWQFALKIDLNIFMCPQNWNKNEVHLTSGSAVCNGRKQNNSTPEIQSALQIALGQWVTLQKWIWVKRFGTQNSLDGSCPNNGSTMQYKNVNPLVAAGFWATKGFT